MGNVLVTGLPLAPEARAAVKATLRERFGNEAGEVVGVTWGNRKGACFVAMASALEASKAIAQVGRRHGWNFPNQPFSFASIRCPVSSSRDLSISTVYRDQFHEKSMLFRGFGSKVLKLRLDFDQGRTPPPVPDPSEWDADGQAPDDMVPISFTSREGKISENRELRKERRFLEDTRCWCAICNSTEHTAKECSTDLVEYHRRVVLGFIPAGEPIDDQRLIFDPLPPEFAEKKALAEAAVAAAAAASAASVKASPGVSTGSSVPRTAGAQDAVGLAGSARPTADNALKSAPLWPGDEAGDWVCSGCRNTNWARRSSCNRCKMPRPSGSVAGRGALPPGTGPRAGGTALGPPCGVEAWEAPRGAPHEAPRGAWGPPGMAQGKHSAALGASDMALGPPASRGPSLAPPPGMVPAHSNPPFDEHQSQPPPQSQPYDQQLSLPAQQPRLFDRHRSSPPPLPPPQQQQQQQQQPRPYDRHRSPPAQQRGPYEQLRSYDQHRSPPAQQWGPYDPQHQAVPAQPRPYESPNPAASRGYPQEPAKQPVPAQSVAGFTRNSSGFTSSDFTSYAPVPAQSVAGFTRNSSGFTSSGFTSYAPQADPHGAAAPHAAAASHAVPDPYAAPDPYPPEMPPSYGGSAGSKRPGDSGAVGSHAGWSGEPEAKKAFGQRGAYPGRC